MGVQPPYDYRDRWADIVIDFNTRVRDRLGSIGATEIDIHLGTDLFEVECVIDGKSYRISRRTGGMGDEYGVCNGIIDAVEALMSERPTSSLRRPPG